MENLNELLEFTKNLARKAGEMTLEKSKSDFKVNFKSTNNLVTEVDLASEKMICEAIEKEYPNHSIYGEESGQNSKQSDYRWIIDPIDGTTNFAHRHPIYGISIGLEFKGEMIIGVVFAPYLDELFHASLGGGAFLNDEQIHVSNVETIKDALVATGFPTRHREVNMKNLEKMMQKAQAIRRCGAATIDLCFVACGRYELFWELGLHAWDIAAGSLILTEAGGEISNLDGSKLNLEGKNMLATNKKTSKEALEILHH